MAAGRDLTTGQGSFLCSTSFDTLKWVCVCARVCTCVCKTLCCCYLFTDFIRFYVFFFLPELPNN